MNPDTRESGNHRQNQRLELRISTELKALIEEAAGFEGRSIADFVRQTVQRHARSVVNEHVAWHPSVRERAALFEVLRNPPAPNERLKRAARRFNKSR